MKKLKAEMESLKQTRQEAEQQATAAAIKMDVLANYFKEKERELNRFQLLSFACSAELLISLLILSASSFIHRANLNQYDFYFVS